MFQYSFKKTQAESNHWKLEYKLIFPLCLPLVAELILDDMFFSYGRLNRKLLFLPAVYIKSEAESAAPSPMSNSCSDFDTRWCFETSSGWCSINPSSSFSLVSNNFLCILSHLVDSRRAFFL